MIRYRLADGKTAPNVRLGPQLPRLHLGKLFVVHLTIRVRRRSQQPSHQCNGYNSPSLAPSHHRPPLLRLVFLLPFSKLVFCDEFVTPGRTFRPSDDPTGNRQSLGATGDLEWSKSLRRTATSSSPWTLPIPGLTPHLLYRPRQPQPNLPLWYVPIVERFCFSSGYIQVSAFFPGPDENTQRRWEISLDRASRQPRLNCGPTHTIRATSGHLP